MSNSWDYLIVTAANDQQAQSYEFQIQQRLRSGALSQIRNCLVVADLDGRRIGSGGSTLHCLLSVLRREGHGQGSGKFKDSFDEAESILRQLRILIVHAGGDSRRLPAYSHCGKMFVPLPSQNDPAVATTLFDRLIPAFLGLPKADAGQVVIASGDALILFDGSAIELNQPGITALGSFAPAGEAAHHGVLCGDSKGTVRRYLQKPSPAAQAAAGTTNVDGESVLDLGVMSCDAQAATQLMRTFFAEDSQPGRFALDWKPESREVLLSQGIDLYREICCALGSETTLEQYSEAAASAGSKVNSAILAQWFPSLQRIPLHLQILPQCHFLHFGTTRQLISSGIALLEHESRRCAGNRLILNSALRDELRDEASGENCWIEGCDIRGTLALNELNVIVGVDVMEPLILLKGECLDLSPGKSRDGGTVWFVRCYGVDDTFKHSLEQGGTFCGIKLKDWLAAVGAEASDVWPAEVADRERTLWNARVFPAVKEHQEFRDWLWLLRPASATPEQKRLFLAADRYSSSDIAVRVDQSLFLERRARMQPRGLSYA